LDFAALVGSWIWILARRVQISQSGVSVENQEEEQLKNLQMQRNTPIFSIYRYEYYHLISWALLS
jgi:hypothetical protein